MSLNIFDYSHAMDRINAATDEIHDSISAGIIAEQEYKAQLEDCIFETRDIIHKMQNESKKDKKWVIIGTISSVIAAIGTIVSLIICFS